MPFLCAKSAKNVDFDHKIDSTLLEVALKTLNCIACLLYHRYICMFEAYLPLFLMQRSSCWDQVPEVVHTMDLDPDSAMYPDSQPYTNTVPGGKEPRLDSVWFSRYPCCTPGGC